MHIARVLFWLALATQSAEAGLSQETLPATGEKVPIARLLRPDGSIDLATGYSGVVDAAGFAMSVGGDGAPRFLQKAASSSTTSACDPDQAWDDRFVPCGLDEHVRAIAVIGSVLYVGGAFIYVNDLRVNHIARWDGNAWSALDAGVNSDVNALAVSGTDLYVGGVFTMAGAVSANRIARWDGSVWYALGAGVNNGVDALAVSGSDLYVGGPFTMAGGVGRNYIARWNGSGWSALGMGLNNRVIALAVSGANVYAGGGFTTAGGMGASYVAHWNGSAWSNLGAGMNNWVYALAVSGTGLYAGGSFTTAGGASANFVARWDGSAWSGVGAGMNNVVSALAMSGANLYAGGYFTTAGGASANRVARWDGNVWSAVGTGIPGDSPTRVSALAVSGAELFVGGGFTTAGGVSANHIARWQGNTWSNIGQNNLGDGIGGATTFLAVRALAVSGNNVYAGGGFTTTGNVSANYVARWNGDSWSALGSGVNFDVLALAVIGTDLYAGGSFTTAGGASANRIARWNGSAWSSLGSGMNGGVLALAVIGTDLYAGGGFTTAGGASANHIARWNGSVWSGLGSGTNGHVLALAVIGTDLYAGGSFTAAGGSSASRIARWNGDSWSALGLGIGGANAEVSSLAASGTDLYAGGGFSSAGGVSASGIARWSGSSWFSLGAGVNGLVNALAVGGTDLYVGGYFGVAGSASANRIARWSGNGWSPLGSGVNNAVLALAPTSASVYAGGPFSAAGGKASSRIARLQLGCGNCLLESGEECDDGNAAIGDGCDAACRLESSPTLTSTGTATPTVAPTDTHSPSPTFSPTRTPSSTPTTARSRTATATFSATLSPTSTGSPTSTRIATYSPTPTPTATATPTQSRTATALPSATLTATTTNTSTSTPSSTRASTSTPTRTFTVGPSASDTATPLAPTETATVTATPTPCTADAQCEDGNPCTSDVCDPSGVCVHERANDGALCAGGSGTCTDGRCIPFPPVPRADLELWAPCRPEPVCAGGLLTCDVHVRNRGPSLVPSVTVTLDLTGDLQLMGGAEPLTVSSGAMADVPVVSPQLVTWIASNLAPGRSASTWFKINVGNAGGVRTVAVVGSVEDPDPDDNQQIETITPANAGCPTTDYAEKAVVSHRPQICATERLFYMLHFAHLGATTADVTDVLPSCLDPGTVEALLPATFCEVTGNTLTCTGLPLDPMGRGLVSFAVAPKLGCAPQTVISNVAAVTFNDGFLRTTAPVNAILGNCENDCSNAFDDNGNGLIDCADRDCQEQVCDDGNACTRRDQCHTGLCTGIPCDACQSCDPITGCLGTACTPTPSPTATMTATLRPSPTPAPSASATPLGKRPLIFIPGILGSSISYGGNRLWPTTDNCLVTRLRPPDNGVPPAAAGSSVVVGGTASVCGLSVSQPVEYGAFLTFLQNRPEHELRSFAYDWRLDLRRTADELSQFVDTALQETGHDRVDIVAHSMGGLLAKAFLARSHLNESRVRHLIFINTPHFGAPWALQALFTGAQITRVGPRARVTAYAARNMPAVYQLLPSRALPDVLAVRDSGFRSQTVPVQSYEDFLVRISAFGWRHQRCLDCPQCLDDVCRFTVESLNANLPGWVRPHEAAAHGGAGWDAWAPVDPELDAVILYSQDFDPEFGVPYTLRRVVVADRTVAIDAIRDVELGAGDGTVPIESARADGVGYFDRAGGRFEFLGEHVEVLLRPELQGCVSGLIKDVRDFSSCVAGSRKSGGALGEGGRVVLEVRLASDGDADLLIRNAAGLETGRTLEGNVEESIPGSVFVDAGQTQLALVPGGTPLTIGVRAVEAVSAILRLQERTAGVGDRELVYQTALQPGGAIEIVHAPAEATAADVDADGDGIVDRVMMPEALPLANAGEPQTVRPGIEVILDGSGSTGPAGTSLDYRWVQVGGPPVVLSDETAIQPRFAAPEVAEDTPLAFALSVAADGLESRPSTSSVLVRTCGPERCNGLDDDCDGLIDQGNPEGGAACSTGRQGACDRGILQCRTGALYCITVESRCEAEGCESAADCQDALFCNGEERCLNGLCVGGTPPCRDVCDTCDEPSGQCRTIAECSCPEHCNEDVAIPPELAVEPSGTRKLGAISVGDRTEVTYAVRNGGGGILTVTPTTPCAEIDVAPESVILLGGIETTLTVSVTPVAAGPFNCELILASNAGEAILELQGVGTTCPGDCNGDSEVTVDELVTLVSAALAGGGVSGCMAGDIDGDNQITVDEIVAAVNSALKGCD